MLTPEDQAWIDEQMTLAGRPPAPKLDDQPGFRTGVSKAEIDEILARWTAERKKRGPHGMIYVPPPAVPPKSPRDWRDLTGGLMIVAILGLMTIRAYQLDGWVALAWMLPCLIGPALAALLVPRKKR